MENKKITTMEDTISIVLRAGVLLSIIVICAGLFLHIVLKLSAGSLIIKTGLYILFLTPFARLVVSLLMFLIEKRFDILCYNTFYNSNYNRKQFTCIN